MDRGKPVHINIKKESKFNLFESDEKHYEPKVSREVSERWRRKSLIQLRGGVNANVYQNLHRQDMDASLSVSSNQPKNLMQDNTAEPGKAVPYSLEC